jgi:hypothetical protein
LIHRPVILVLVQMNGKQKLPTFLKKAVECPRGH